MNQKEAFTASVVDALRMLAYSIETGAVDPVSIRHDVDSLTVTYRRTDSEGGPSEAKPRGDPKRPCEHTSKPVTAGGDEVACPDCGAVWTP